MNYFKKNNKPTSDKTPLSISNNESYVHERD